MSRATAQQFVYTAEFKRHLPGGDLFGQPFFGNSLTTRPLFVPCSINITNDGNNSTLTVTLNLGNGEVATLRLAIPGDSITLDNQPNVNREILLPVLFEVPE